MAIQYRHNDKLCDKIISLYRDCAESFVMLSPMQMTATILSHKKKNKTKMGEENKTE